MRKVVAVVGSDGVEVIRDIEFARLDSGPLALDLYRPAGVRAAKTVL